MQFVDFRTFSENTDSVGNLKSRQTERVTAKKIINEFKTQQIMSKSKQIIHLPDMEVNNRCIQYVPKPFLSSCIPNLQLYRLASDIHNFRTELYADSMARILFDCHTSKREKKESLLKSKFSGKE